MSIVNLEHSRLFLSSSCKSSNCSFRPLSRFKMMHSQAPKRTLQCAARARHFSTTCRVAAVSPYRPTKTSHVAESTKKRDQSTAAAPAVQRAAPSPAFNRHDTTNFKDVQPLQPLKQPELDHSFVGMKGGEIFHEMMLRQNVKHVCTLHHLRHEQVPRRGKCRILI